MSRKNNTVNLDNSTSNQTGSEEEMPKRFKEKVKINGNIVWIDGYSIQELMDNYLWACVKEGVVRPTGDGKPVLFRPYAEDYFETFKTNQAKNTLVNRDRILRNHIYPQFGSMSMQDISVSAIQKWFNTLAKSYSHETLLKIKNTMSLVMDAAVEDKIIDSNPFRSKRLHIGGKETVPHRAIPKIKMEVLRKNLKTLPLRQKRMAALLSYTGMRMEEVLGLRWEDVDTEEGVIHILRAVTHPERNQPLVKPPKTRTSTRDIPLTQEVEEGLMPFRKTGFILSTIDSSEEPLSYSEARGAYERIQKEFDLKDYTPHDFRDTCATEWRENGMSLDLIARLLGHAKTETTERRYVKYRDEAFKEAKAKMHATSA